MQLNFSRRYNNRMSYTISSCLINIRYPAKNNIQTALENILAIFEGIREYGVYEKR